MIEQLETGKKVVGIKQVRRAILAGLAQRVFLADDADPALTENLQQLCDENGVQTESVRSMAVLGKRCEIAVGAACAAILR